jgi:hypothetical protein
MRDGNSRLQTKGWKGSMKKDSEATENKEESGSPKHNYEFTSAPAKIASTSLTKEHEKFTKALASVLSASPEQIRESRAQAKAEKPSHHTRYSYVPAKGRP